MLFVIFRTSTFVTNNARIIGDNTNNTLNKSIMDTTLLFLNLGAPEIIIIALVILLIFGGKKIPELMKGLGKGVRSFKEGMKDIDEEINKDIDKKD